MLFRFPSFLSAQQRSVCYLINEYYYYYDDDDNVNYIDIVIIDDVRHVINKTVNTQFRLTNSTMVHRGNTNKPWLLNHAVLFYHHGLPWLCYHGVPWFTVWSDKHVVKVCNRNHCAGTAMLEIKP